MKPVGSITKDDPELGELVRTIASKASSVGISTARANETTKKKMSMGPNAGKSFSVDSLTPSLEEAVKARTIEEIQLLPQPSRALHEGEWVPFPTVPANAVWTAIDPEKFKSINDRLELQIERMCHNIDRVVAKSAGRRSADEGVCTNPAHSAPPDSRQTNQPFPVMASSPYGPESDSGEAAWCASCRPLSTAKRENNRLISRVHL